MIKRFQPMLLAFLLPAFFLTQLISGYFVYSQTREQLTETSRIALTTTKENFRQHLLTTRSSLIKSAQILAADFGFRSAVASGDPNTINSALVNLSRRVGVSHAALVTADGNILADIADDFDSGLSKSAVSLLNQAIVEGQSNSLISVNNHIHQTVVVPVLAPEPIGWIFIADPIDENTIAALREQSTFDMDISFTLVDENSAAKIAVTSLDADRISLLTHMADEHAFAEELSDQHEKLFDMGGEAYITLIEDLRGSSHDEPIFMVIVSSINKALKPYDPLFQFLFLVGVLGFCITAFFAVMIARRMTKPLGEMVSAAKRYQSGDYSEKLTTEGPTELVELASSLNLMSEEIAERERQIFNAANFDDITQLPNTARAIFDIREKIDAEPSDCRLTAAVIRLENTADVRTTIGQDMANLLVTKIVERLTFLKTSDSELYRVSDSELLYLNSSRNVVMREKIATHIATALDAPIGLQGVDIDPQIHIGFAEYHPAIDARALIRRADVAAEQAAANGSLFEVYDRDYDEYMAERLSLVSDMRRALENDEMSVYYQPKIDLAKNE
ncbi:MAG: cache domain-containing protein, partial [Pseudomonadota bacterium]